MTDLDRLEAQAVPILRETVALFERQGRLIDKDEAGAMERKKRDGYF